jgi:hypothetical protein
MGSRASLTGFDRKEIDDLLIAPEEDERANATPPLPENTVSRFGNLWIGGAHRVLCWDATSSDVVAKLLGERKPSLMVTDPPYGIELDSEWVTLLPEFVTSAPGAPAIAKGVAATAATADTSQLINGLPPRREHESLRSDHGVLENSPAGRLACGVDFR